MLQHFAVDGEADGELVGVGDFVGGDDGGAERAEGGEAFAHGPLRGSELHVARADIVDDGVAVDVIAPSGGGDAVAALADDEGEFGLIVGLGGVLGSTMGSPGPMMAVWSLKKTTGVVGSAMPDSLAWSR